MELNQLIRRLRDRYDGFNEPADDAELRRLEKSLGWLPQDVLTLYRDHDGSSTKLERGDTWLPGRLMPISEVLESQGPIDEFFEDRPSLGDIAWLWTDDNSNYVGVYTSGVLQGWLAKLNHDEPNTTPAWRSVASFLQRLLDSAPGIASERDEAIDVVMVPRGIPVTADDPKFVAADRALVQTLRNELADADDEDLRRLLAMCIICLTPVEDTDQVLAFLAEDDIWTPESAITLLELRQYQGPVGPIERLAREGRTNGDSAAIRLLVRMKTPESEAALARLEQDLTGQKRKMLELWVRSRDRLQPPQLD